MKKIVLLIAFCLISVCKVMAQGESDTTSTDSTTIIFMSITDPTQFTIDPVTSMPNFMDPVINSIFSSYTVTDFSQAFPDSRFEYLKEVWKITCKSENLAHDLQTYNHDLFPYYELRKLPQVTSYTPNDPQGVTAGDQEYLRYIGAEDAWGLTKGNSNVIIGITDTWLNTANPDLVSKVVSASPNTYSYGPQEHGTQVSGFAVAATDNGQLLCGMGFNCSEKFSSNWGDDNEILKFSKQGVRVTNGSWINSEQNNNSSGTTALDLTNYIYGQGIYDEVYENGTSAVFSAGNGDIHYHTDYNFPASYNHNISVSSLGWMNPTGGGVTFCQKDVHLIDVADPSKPSHTHNKAVDICAGGVSMNCLSYSSTAPKDYGWNEGWGTSFSSPQVAGTIGLMLSVNPCLSPYQIEYILKTTGYNVDAISANVPYAGLLGAGRLQAGRAVAKAKSLSCNNKTTQTLQILGVNLNTICSPGFSTPAVNPQFSVVIAPNTGQPPYTYKWYALPGNNTTLDHDDIGNPQIMSATGNLVAYYRVTVIDNSTVPKVASKVVKVQLTTDNTYKLTIRDSYVDVFDEPNSQATVDPREWNIWEGPDLWNRINADGLPDHQNVNLATSTTNYAYVRIHNVGCAASPSSGAAVHLYWTKASLGEKWPTDWTGLSYVNGHPAGGEITPSSGLAIPAMNPGDVLVLDNAWNPIDPYLWDPTTFKAHVCFLGRIVDPGGMTFTEGVQTTPNALNNRRVATRNLDVVNTNPVMITGWPNHQIDVANPESVVKTFNLQMINDRAINPQFAGDLSKIMYVTLHLGDLYDIWQAGGSEGDYATKDEVAKTVTFDGSTTMELRNITLNGGDRYPVNITFSSRDTSEVDSNRYHVHFRQMNTDGSPASASTTVYGNFSFELYVSKDTTADSTLSDTTAYKANYKELIEQPTMYVVYPNPASETINIVCKEDEVKDDIIINDVSGRVIVRLRNAQLYNGKPFVLKTSNLSPGMYNLTISDSKGHAKTFKISKIE